MIASSPLLTAVAALNGLTLLAFGIDKRRAQRGRRRVAERALLGLALIGGTPGAYAGRALFRHKTCKQPFVRRLHAIALLQGLGLCTLIVGWRGGA